MKKNSIELYFSLRPATRILNTTDLILFPALLELLQEDIQLVYIRSTSVNTCHLSYQGKDFIIIDDCAIEYACNYMDFTFKEKTTEEESFIFSYALTCKKLSRIFLENGYPVHAYVALINGKGLAPALSYENYETGLVIQHDLFDRELFKQQYINYSCFHEYAHILLRNGAFENEIYKEQVISFMDKNPAITATVEQRRKALKEAADLNPKSFIDRERYLFSTSEQFEKFYGRDPYTFVEVDIYFHEICCDLYATRQIFTEAIDSKRSIEGTIRNLILFPFANNFNNLILLECQWLIPFLNNLSDDPEITDELVTKALRSYSDNDTRRHTYVYEIYLRLELIRMNIATLLKENDLVHIRLQTIFEETLLSHEQAKINMFGPIELWNNEPLLTLLKQSENYIRKLRLKEFKFQAGFFADGSDLSQEQFGRIVRTDIAIANGFATGEQIFL